MTTPRTMADLVSLFLSGGLAALSGQPDTGPDPAAPITVNGIRGAARSVCPSPGRSPSPAVWPPAQGKK
jgi:hypothetical protein